MAVINGEKLAPIIRLCSDAGSELEFASAEAITIRKLSEEKLPAAVNQLTVQTEHSLLLLKPPEA